MPTAWLDLPAPPALPGLFLRAALRRGIRGKALPERGLRSQVTVDPKHLERYRQVCGFRDDGLLPPTYPHILAFPLQMALLTDKRFPFPLLGLVHLENRIDVLRALGGLGPFTVSVAVENLQPHDKGATFSIVTRLEDQLGLLWVGDSKVLCRGVKVPGEIPPKAEQEPLPLEPVDNWKAPADIGRRYARAAGDYNPIHLSTPSAKLFGFPRAIAHGLWNKARSLAALGERLPASGYRVEVRFQKPVLLPASLTLLASAAAADGQFSLRGKDDLPHMVGHWSRLQG
ncbi:MaoC family dehydratase [Pseudomonas aeruginosa]|uniref:MaoC family dehydratase n=1 Tax=Pseudomonas aeruginosa TaxID=287 RepID=UPI00295585E8|nr:MaoC/PaaZ C-terminal domain-containing protein [Pseudomonas aeruginosa]MDV7846248.1 MaoC/PaaZ C-terminal domain-containing protein [Pseudomonas aeruginosa]